MRHAVTLIVASALVPLSHACGGGSGSSTVTDTVPDTFLTLHTVFGWITTEALNDGAWQPVTPQPLTLYATGASFDATSDLQFGSQGALANDLQDQANDGYVAMAVADISALTIGMPYAFTAHGDSCTLVFGQAPLPDTTAPPVVPSDNYQQQCALTLRQLGAGPGQDFAGTLVVTVTPTVSGPLIAPLGKVTVQLSGPLVNQLLGLCNLNLLNSGEVLTGCRQSL